MIRNTRPTLVVIDDFLSDPMAWRQFAMQQEFKENPAYHKGARTPKKFLPNGFKEAIERALGLRIPNWEQFGTNGAFHLCVSGEQTVYHSDAQDYAGVLYLTPNAPPQSGTALYRSKNFKWRSAPSQEDASKIGVRHEVAVCEMYSGKLLDPTAWEEVDVAGNVFNRLVLFASKNVHSARNYFGTNMTDGRLFQLFFFNVE